MFRTIAISHFRGFHKLRVEQLDRFNLILGKNNVGKTAFLEAIYLLVGPTNPELPLRLNIFRGVEQVRIDPEEMWGWLFNVKNLKNTIELEAVNDHARTRSLRISLREPKEFRGVRARRKAIKSDLLTAATTTTASPPDLMLNYQSESGERVRTRAFLKEGGLAFDHDKTLHLPNSIFMIARAGYSAENPERFSKLEEVGGEKDLLPPLMVLEPRLKRLAVLVTGNGPVVHGDIGIGRMVPVPLMGEGVGKLLTLLLSIVSAKDGVLLVDEIETGLHYSVMADVWTAVASTARKHHVQLFATTHSWECLRAAHQSFSGGETYDFKLHRLDRIGDQVESLTYDRKKIDLALASGMELR